MSALVGLLLHTFVDGVAVASGLDVGGAARCAGVHRRDPAQGARRARDLEPVPRRGRRAAGARCSPRRALGVATIAGVVLTVAGRRAARPRPRARGGRHAVRRACRNLVPEFQRARRMAPVRWRSSPGSGVYFARAHRWPASVSDGQSAGAPRGRSGGAVAVRGGRAAAAARRAHASAHARRVRRAAAPARAGQAAARGDRAGQRRRRWCSGARRAPARRRSPASIAQYTDREFVSVLRGHRRRAARARDRRARRRTACDTGRGTILFVDEIHRFNKAQQDAFLPHVEAGTITLIGATTENPSSRSTARCCRACACSCCSRSRPTDIAGCVRRALADARARARRAGSDGRRRRDRRCSRRKRTATRGAR